MAVEITGPGTQAHNGAVIGGGFGLRGAVKGMLEAAAINALTSRTTTNTFLRLATSDAEVFLHTSAVEPASLRMSMSRAIMGMDAGRTGDTGTLPAQLRELDKLRKEGVLSEDEFRAAKRRLLGNESV